MDTIAILVVCTIIIVLNGWLLYWKQYMTKKGENKAMEEDIQLLTEKVEEVKKEFNESLERVKAELSLFTHQQFNLSSEERNSIFKYFDAYNRWLHFATNLDSNDHSDGAFEKRVTQYSLITCEYDTAESRLEIFFNDQAFLDLKCEINQMTIKCKSLGDECFFDMRKIDLEANQVRAAVHQGKAPPDDYGKVLEKKVAAHSAYLDKQSTQLQQPLFGLLRDFRKMLKDKLIETLKVSA